LRERRAKERGRIQRKRKEKRGASEPHVQASSARVLCMRGATSPASGCGSRGKKERKKSRRERDRDSETGKDRKIKR